MADLSTVTTNFFATPKEGFTTTTASSIAGGATTVPLNSVTGYVNGSIATFVIEPTSSTAKQAFTGVVDTSGIQLTSVKWTEGSNQTHNAGSTVVDYTTATHFAALVKGLLVDHLQNGGHGSLHDTNGNTILGQTAVASAVNYFKNTNAIAGSGPILGADGSDSNIDLWLKPKGTGKLRVSGAYDGWNEGVLAPNSVTYNGNRSYSLVFNTTDLTPYLSPGMRLKLTRTVTAPTQCTSLNGTTQYYSKTSPNKLTFTNNFVVSAWIKLTAYNAGAKQTIVSRFNGTNGWGFSILTTGQLELAGYNANIANYSVVTSYQSIPLNKWVHVASQLDMATFTATTTTSYVMIDGLDVPAVVSRAGTNPTALIQAGNLEIGSLNGGTLPFGGKLAQVAIYSAKVTQANIVATISQGLVGNETSLASAYSFNNSIADLNTTTPNDLTPNGSAVATNADTPFTQTNGLTGYAVGTTNYGIIVSSVFSTNTTLVVQVPEGDTLPTTGGITNVSYSTQKAPYGFPSQRAKWRIISFYRAGEPTVISISAINQWFASHAVINVPIGEWKLAYEFTPRFDSSVSGIRSGFITLDIAPTNADYASENTARMPYLANTATTVTGTISKSFDRSLAAATLYTLFGSIDVNSGVENWNLNAGQGGSIIYAECAYY